MSRGYLIPFLVGSSVASWAGTKWAAGLVACPEAYAKKATTKRPGDGMAEDFRNGCYKDVYNS